jgi:4-hydroxybenzoate polyprenyltransferase
MRPAQWIKNTFVFAALIFAQHFFLLPSVLRALAAFVIFCLLSSSVYLINDIFDRNEDRNHPAKAKRPIASGSLAVRTVIPFVILFITTSMAASVALGAHFGYVALAYLLLNVLYSTLLKHWVILDVLTLGIGFVLRAIAGAVVINVEFSRWLVLCTFLLALFLGFCKRRHEMILLNESAVTHRKILAEYSPYFLDRMIAVVTTSSVMSYVLYTMSEETIQKFHSKNLIYTTIFVIYGIFRYLYLIDQKQKGGSPTGILLRDFPLQITILLWLISAFLIIYWSKG